MAEFRLQVDLGDGQLKPVIVEAPDIDSAVAKVQALQKKPASFAERFAGEPQPPATDIEAPQQARALEAGLVKEAEARGRPTPLQSFAIGGGQGAALGSWLDEITGALGATFSKQPDEAWSDAFTRHQQSAQRGIETSRAINPKSHIGGQATGIVAGALGTGGAAIPAGMISGAVSGAGEGDTAEERALNAGIGTVVGGVAGAAAPYIARGVGAAGHWAKDQVGKLGSALGLNATGKIARALQDAGVDPATARRMIDEAQARSQDLNIGDVGTTATGREARLAANVSPTAQAELQAATGPRASPEATTGRLRNFLDQVGGGGETAATRDALDRQARLVNERNYLQAYRQHPAVWDQTLEGLTSSPAVQDAIRRTLREGADIATTQGIRPPQAPFVQQADGTLTPRIDPQTGQRAIPSLQFWDYVKRNLGDAGRGERGDRARVLFGLERQLRTHLDQVAPAYGATRSTAAEFFGADNALDAGRNLAGGGSMNAEASQRARQAVQAMSPAERRLLEVGYLDEISNKAGQGAASARTVFAGPNQRRAAELVLGPQRARQLEGFLEAERLMTAFHGQVHGGSSTARQGFDMLRSGGGTAALGAIAGGAGGLAQGDDAKVPAAVGAGAGLAAGIALSGSRGAQASRLARLLTSQDPAVQNRVFRAMTQSPLLRRQVEDIVAKTAGPLAVQQFEETRQ